MDAPDTSPGHDGEPDPERRTVLAALLAAYLLPLVPSANARPAAEAARNSFLAVSEILTGRSPLDAAQAARLYEALAAEFPGFQGDVEALRTLIGVRRIDPGQLQQTLDVEQSPLAALPRQIVTAWYTGIVGEGGRARCITFETSLMHQIVADRLSPPSYCYGPPGSWVDAPI